LDEDHYVLPGRHEFMTSHVRFVELDIAGLYPQMAALSHGIARVQREVQNHLLDLSRVGLHGSQRRFQYDGNLNIFAD